MATLSDILSENHFSLALTDGTLTGTGVDFLVKQAKEAQFFLFGEDHGIAENLNFATALFKLLQPTGYNSYVTEIGPFSAEYFNRYARQPDAMRAFHEFYSKYPFSIPFGWLQEEVHLLQTVATTATSPQPPIIGIDQEFIISPQLHFEKLKMECTDPLLREKVGIWHQAEQKANKDMHTGKQMDQLAIFMNTPLPEEWPALREHFESQSNSKAIAVMDAIADSHEIYMYYKTEDYYLNNHVRSLLMKKYFYEAYQKRTGTKYFIKLGANHIKRGHSAMNIQDIGNFISELAVMENTPSFHLFVFPYSGEQNVWLPFAPEEYKAAQIEENTNPMYKPILEALPDKSNWHLYDLRPLRMRQNLWAKDNPEFKNLIQGYDAVLLMGNVKAAQLVVQ
jgi:hypothetical protein